MKKLILIATLFIGCSKAPIEINTVVIYDKATIKECTARRDGKFIRIGGIVQGSNSDYANINYDTFTQSIQWRLRSNSTYLVDTIRMLPITLYTKSINGTYKTIKSVQFEFKNLPIN